METTRITYQVHVTPSFGQNLEPQYLASISRNVRDGICGPIGDIDVAFTSILDLDLWLGRSGFVRVGNFGPVCANGFASANLDTVGR